MEDFPSLSPPRPPRRRGSSAGVDWIPAFAGNADLKVRFQTRTYIQAGAHTAWDAVVSPSERGSGARRSAPWVVQFRIAAEMRVSTHPDRPFLPGVAVGVADRRTKGEAPGALAPLPVTGATCQGLAETALAPPVLSLIHI